MPRRNRSRGRHQHPKKLRMGGRPRGWHRAAGSANVRLAVRWLNGEGRA